MILIKIGEPKISPTRTGELLTLWELAHFSDHAATEAVCRVIVDYAGRLHPRINDDRTYEFEPSLLQYFG